MSDNTARPKGLSFQSSNTAAGSNSPALPSLSEGGSPATSNLSSPSNTTDSNDDWVLVEESSPPAAEAPVTDSLSPITSPPMPSPPPPTPPVEFNVSSRGRVRQPSQRLRGP